MNKRELLCKICYKPSGIQSYCSDGCRCKDVQFQLDRSLKRIKELEEALKFVIDIADSQIHNEYDGTDMVDDLLAELNPSRKTLNDN